MPTPCPRPQLPPFSPRDCAADPNIIGIIPKRSSPDCNAIQDPPDALISSFQINVLPPIVSPPTFGCIRPFALANVGEDIDGFSADLISTLVDGSTDPCDQKIQLDILVPPFVVNPNLNPPCGDFSISASANNGGTADPSMAASVTPSGDYGCDRSVGISLNLPTLVFDMNFNSWPALLDARLAAGDMVTLLSKLESTDWVTVLSVIEGPDWETLFTNAGVEFGGGGGGGLVVQIKSHVAGKEYLVDVYGEGKNRPATEVGVSGFQLQIDDTLDTIPADTWAIAAETRYIDEFDEEIREIWFQVPIWLGPTA